DGQCPEYTPFKSKRFVQLVEMNTPVVSVMYTYI
ncbi:hypothetical protein ZOSMA_59G00770, partial [Zostera marina]